MTDRSRSFVPVVVVGVGSAALAAVAGARPWVVHRSLEQGSDPFGEAVAAGEMPLALALALVALACWGVALVTRRAVRRAVLALASVAAAGLVVTVVVGVRTLPERVVEAVPDAVTTTPGAELTATTGWFWLSAVTAVLLVVSSLVAFRWSPAWPEMGSRYDAPGRSAEPEPPPGERSSLDLWKSLDEGRDPTA